MRVDLILLAKGTALYVAADEGGEPRPPKFSGDKLVCFQETGVAGRLMVMAACENGAAKGIICVTRDVLLVGRAKPNCLEGGTHKETLRPQVNSKVECQRLRRSEVLSRLLKDPRIR